MLPLRKTDTEGLLRSAAFPCPQRLSGAVSVFCSKVRSSWHPRQYYSLFPTWLPTVYKIIIRRMTIGGDLKNEKFIIITAVYRIDSVSTARRLDLVRVDLCVAWLVRDVGSHPSVYYFLWNGSASCRLEGVPFFGVYACTKSLPDSLDYIIFLYLTIYKLNSFFNSFFYLSQCNLIVNNYCVLLARIMKSRILVIIPYLLQHVPFEDYLNAWPT